MVNEDGKWDPATVTGIRSNERVLVIGNPAFMPWLTLLFERNTQNLVSVRKVSEIEALLHEGQHFDRIILPRETPYSHDHILRTAVFRAQLICFPTDDGWSIEQSVQFYYPDAQVRKFDSTFGTVIIAEPFGTSWRMIYG
jgi:hypothetical protein